MVRLYADENFPRPVVEELRRLGYDVLTLQEAGYAGQALSDEQVLKDASHERRGLLTINRRHFINLHKTSSQHTGTVVCSFDPRFIEQAKRIHQALDSYGSDLAGQLLRINRPPKT